MILVTGGAGYLGVCLVRQLLEAGHRVRVLDAMLYGDEWLATIGAHERLEVIVGDLRDANVVESAMAGATDVVHLAAIVGDAACTLDPDLAWDVNVAATARLVAVASAAGVRRFLFASTCSVYGAGEGVLDERSPLHPVSLYAASKLAAEHAVLEAAGGRLEPVVLRFASLYGRAPRPRFDLVVNLLTAKAVRDGLVTIHGGEQSRPFLHVEDCARAVLALLAAPAAGVSGEVLNVGDPGGNYRLREVGALILELVPDASLTVDERVVDRRTYAVDVTKLAATVPFVPRQSLRRGIKELRDWLRGAPLDYADPAYSNAASLAARHAGARQEEPTASETHGMPPPWWPRLPAFD